jgi:hypothetical protein
MHKGDKEIYIRKTEGMGWHMRDNVLYIVYVPATNYELEAILFSGCLNVRLQTFQK